MVQHQNIKSYGQGKIWQVNISFGNTACISEKSKYWLFQGFRAGLKYHHDAKIVKLIYSNIPFHKSQILIMVPFYRFHHQEDDSKHILLRVFLVGNLISYISSKTRKCIFLVVMCILLDTGFDTIPLKKRFTFSQWSKRILQIWWKINYV